MIQKQFICVGFLAILLFLCVSASAQKAKSVHWLTFKQLEDSLIAHQHTGLQKKVFIDFYTDWCTYCRKMDKVVFTKPAVIELLNEQYYAVRFDAESASPVYFGGKKLINDQVGNSRTPIHQIAQILALKNGQFTPPAMVTLDTAFNVTARYFEYMDSGKLLKALKQ